MKSLVFSLRTLLSTALLVAGSQLAWSQGLGIGTATPDPSAVVEMQATNKGLLVPRMTEAARTALAAPAKGLLLFQTDGSQPGFWYNAGDNVTKTWAFLPNITTGGNYALGYGAGPVSGSLFNAGAIGTNAQVTQSNSLVLGDGSINVGIGTSAPRGALDVTSGDTYLVNDLSNGSGQKAYLPGLVYLAPNAGSGSFATIQAKGASGSNVALRLRTTINGNFVEALQFQANGNALFAGTITAANFASSDLRLKRNIRPLGGALAAVRQLRGVRYEYRQDIPARTLPTGEQVGVIAQEVEKLYPELVITNADGYKAVNYAQLTPVLLEAIKEQQAQIEALKTQATTATQRADRAEASTASFGQRLQALEAAAGPAGTARAQAEARP